MVDGRKEATTGAREEDKKQERTKESNWLMKELRKEGNNQGKEMEKSY